MQVDPLAEVRDILRSLVGNAAHVILEDQHGCFRMAVGNEFLHIDDGAVRDAANLVEPIAALTLDLGSGLLFAAKHPVGGKYGSSAGGQQGIKAKGKHIVGGAEEQALFLQTEYAEILDQGRYCGVTKV